jgi:hypothetical protein
MHDAAPVRAMIRWSALLLLLAVGACGSTAKPGSDGGGGSSAGGVGGTAGGGGRGGGAGSMGGQSGGGTGGCAPNQVWCPGCEPGTGACYAGGCPGVACPPPDGGAGASGSGGSSGSGGARGGQSGSAGPGQGGQGGATGTGGTGGQGVSCQTNASCPSGQVCYRGFSPSCAAPLPGTCVTRESTNCGQTTASGCPCLALPSATTCSGQGAYCSGSDEPGQCWLCKLPQ